MMEVTQVIIKYSDYLEEQVLLYKKVQAKIKGLRGLTHSMARKCKASLYEDGCKIDEYYSNFIKYYELNEIGGRKCSLEKEFDRIARQLSKASYNDKHYSQEFCMLCVLDQLIFKPYLGRFVEYIYVPIIYVGIPRIKIDMSQDLDDKGIDMLITYRDYRFAFQFKSITILGKTFTKEVRDKAQKLIDNGEIDYYLVICHNQHDANQIKLNLTMRGVYDKYLQMVAIPYEIFDKVNANTPSSKDITYKEFTSELKCMLDTIIDNKGLDLNDYYVEYEDDLPF